MAESEMSFGSNSGTSDEHHFYRFGFRSSLSEIERWLDNQLTISTTHLISYLSSPEGLDIVRQIADNRSLSSQIVIKLAKLVTRDDIRCVAERFDTNKIYGASLGSAFLTHIQAHVGAMMEPKREDLWPFLHLLEEMQNRTEDGWRFFPAETLREAINEIPEGAEKFKLSQQFYKFIEYRNKMKKLQQLSKSEEQYQWIMHDWGHEECIKILKSCRKAIPEMEKLIIVDVVALDSNHRGGDNNNGGQKERPVLDPNLVLVFDLVMVVHFSGGKERTEKEWKKILLEGGFSHYKIITIPL